MICCAGVGRIIRGLDFLVTSRIVHISRLDVGRNRGVSWHAQWVTDEPHNLSDENHTILGIPDPLVLCNLNETHESSLY